MCLHRRRAQYRDPTLIQSGVDAVFMMQLLLFRFVNPDLRGTDNGTLIVYVFRIGNLTVQVLPIILSWTQEAPEHFVMKHNIEIIPTVSVLHLWIYL